MIVQFTENTETFNVTIAEVGQRGLAGESAYQYAIRTGQFVGNIEEWYDSITEPSALATQALIAIDIAIDQANEVIDNGDRLIDDLTTSLDATILATEDANNAGQNAINATQDSVIATANATAATIQTELASNRTNVAATNANNRAATTEAVRLATIIEKDKAELATTQAITAASQANTARDQANTAKDNAITATSQANTAKDAANLAAENINSKVQLNNRDTGNILRANGTVFESVPEVEFLRNINAYRRAPDSKFFDNKQIVAWDNFDRPNENPTLINDSGQIYSPLKGKNGLVINKFQSGLLTFEIPVLSALGLEFSFNKATFANTHSAILIMKNELNYFYFGRNFANQANTSFPEIPVDGENYKLYVVINGVSTLLGGINTETIYSGGINDAFLNTRITFVIKYANRGRSDNSKIVVQSLDSPSQKFEVFVTDYNSTFTAGSFTKIGLVSEGGLNFSYKIANLKL